MIFKKTTQITETQVMDFFKSLMEASHAVHVFVEKVFFAQSDITMLQFGILKQLVEHGGSVYAMTDLWCHQHTTRGNLTGIVHRMIQAGLLTRKEGVDRRQKIISLTPLGTKKYNEIESQMRGHIPDFIVKMRGIPLLELTNTLQIIRDLHSDTAS